MKPLLEEPESLPPEERRLAELFAAAEPYRTDLLRKRRIHVRLTTPRIAPRRRFRPALVVAALLVAGTAAAALGHHFLVNQPPLEQPPIAVTSTPRPAKVSAKASPAPVAAIEPAEAAAVEPTSPTSTPALAKASKPVAQRRTGPVKQSSTPRAGEDPTRVAEALRALRKEGDARRAQTLLNQYLKQNPNGALSEEALALAIEAAHARQDPQAKVYARRYLRGYPAGRHRSLALGVLRK